jgi:hypothetical protein
MGIRVPGGRSMLGLLAGPALLGGPARAETLGGVLAAHGMPSPPPRLGRVDQPLETYQVLDDERDLVVVYGPGLPERALDPGVLRAIFHPDVH